MAKNNGWVVRVTLTPAQNSGHESVLVECFRYMGIVGKVADQEDGGLTFEVHPPYQTAPEQWATMNAQRIRSFGLTADPVRIR